VNPYLNPHNRTAKQQKQDALDILLCIEADAGVNTNNAIAKFLGLESHSDTSGEHMNWYTWKILQAHLKAKRISQTASKTYRIEGMGLMYIKRGGEAHRF
jgi:hypothetical protein